MGYNYKAFVASSDTEAAKKKRNQYENLVNNYGNFSYARENDYNAALDSVLNRGKFTYDIATDPLYKQYKDQYVGLGRAAMADTVAKVAGANGGFGNSYGASAGNQAFQNYLAQLNDKIPELKNAALNEYNAQTSEMYNKLSALSSDKNTNYNLWLDKYNRLAGNRDYYGNQYQSGLATDRSAYDSDRGFDFNRYADEENRKWQQRQFEYQKQQDAIANQLNQAQLNETIRAHKASEAASARASDQSATIAALKNQAANAYDSKAANNVKSKIVSLNDFKAGSTVTPGSSKGTSVYRFNGKNYSSYNDYVTYQLKSAYNNGKINENTYAELLNYYNHFGAIHK